MQTLEIVFPGHFNEALSADVAADIEAVMIQRERSDQAGYTAVAVPKRMDTEEVKQKVRNCDERSPLFVYKGLSVPLAKPCDCLRLLLGHDAPESDGRGLAPREPDDVVVDAFELTGIAAGGPAQRVQARPAWPEWTLFSA